MVYVPVSILGDKAVLNFCDNFVNIVNRFEKKNTFCKYGTLRFVLQKHQIITIIITIIIVVKCTAKS